MSNRVHLLLAYGNRNRLIRVDLHVWIARFVLAVLIAIPLTVGYLLIDRNRRVADQKTLAALKYENAVLKGKMDGFAADVDSLKGVLSDLAEHDAQVRLSANLPLIPSDVRKMGIGGGMVDSKEPGADLQTSIDVLLDQARFQDQSFTSIANDLARQSQLQTSTPSIMPTSGWITSPYGPRTDPITGHAEFHEGIDIVGVPGQPIRATADGVVITAGWDANWGKVVEIDHGRGIHTFYAHNASVVVNVGQQVKRGQEIATLGSTGRSTGCHCHYGVKVNGAWVNPAKYILSSGSGSQSD
jgi:murein DD-endopeptidase MepM/ murein hydrolase activator NlpD